MANSLAFYGLGLTLSAILLSTQVFAHEQSQTFHSLNSEEVDRHGYKQAEGYHYSNRVGSIGAENAEQDQIYHFGRHPNLWHAENSWAFPVGKTTAMMRNGGKVGSDSPCNNSPPDYDECVWRLVCEK